MSDVTADWRYLLWGEAEPAPAVPARLRLHAVAHTARTLVALRRKGWAAASRHLREMRPGPGSAAVRALPAPVALRLARRELLFAQLVLRIFVPDALCLARASALAAYLGAIGLPAEVVLGRQRTRTNARFAFHAWTELGGEVLNDIPGVQSGYAALQRVAAGAAAATAGP